MNNHPNTTDANTSVTRRRRERERAQRERQIVRAAERIFAKKGFQGATIQEIAQEAELSVGTIYNFFESKEKLYSTIITSRLDEMRDAVLSRIHTVENAWEQLKIMLDYQAEFIERNREFFIIFLQAQNRFAWTFAKELDEEVAKRFKRYLETLESIFTAGIKEGTMRPLSAEDLAEAWAGMTNAFFLKWLEEKPRWSLKSKAVLIFEIFMHGVAQ